MEKPKAPAHLVKMDILTSPSIAEAQSYEKRQGNSLQEYEQRFEQLSEGQKLSKLRSEAGLRLVEIGHNFYTLATPRGEGEQSLCREYTMLPDEKGTRVKGWIRNNEGFGPFLDVKVCNHDQQHSVEVQVRSWFEDQAVSWVRSVNGVDKFVREAMPTQEEEIASGTLIAKARPRPKSSAM